MSICYKDGTDRLISFGTELFAYDNIGNPKTYRNMSCMWESQNKVSTLSRLGKKWNKIGNKSYRIFYNDIRII